MCRIRQAAKHNSIHGPLGNPNTSEEREAIDTLLALGGYEDGSHRERRHNVTATTDTEIRTPGSKPSGQHTYTRSTLKLQFASLERDKNVTAAIDTAKPRYMKGNETFSSNNELPCQSATTCTTLPVLKATRRWVGR